MTDIVPAAPEPEVQTPEELWPDHTPEQREALLRLAHSLAALADSLGGVRTAGMRYSEAFRACGIEVPAFAAPLLDQVLPG